MRFAAPTLLAVAAMAFIIVALFGKTVFLGMPLSKAHLLSQMDSLFYPVLKSAKTVAWFDPSLYYFHIPVQLLARSLWQGGCLPLWNPYNGCGSTLIGDIQFCLFAPHRLLFPAASQYAYNLGITVKVAAAAIGTFALARQLALPPAAALFSGFAYGLSPFILRELELPNETWLLPVILLAFLKLAHKTDLRSRALLGAACAIFIYSMHPEFSFMGIVLGCLLSGLCVVFGEPGGAPAPPLDPAGGAGRLASLPSLTATLFVSAVIAFFLAAPVLLPFAEFVANGQSYKFGHVLPQYAPWQTMVYNLVNPGYPGGSPFLGILAAVFLPLAFLSPRAAVKPLALLALGIALLTAIPGPIAQLFLHKPISFLVPRYGLGPWLLVISCLSAFGLQVVIERARPGRNRATLVLALAAAAVAAAPWLVSALRISFTGWDFDGGLPPMRVDFGAARRDGLVVAAMIGAWLLSNRFDLSLPRKALLLGIVAAGLNLASEASLCRTALPVQPSFRYPLVSPLDKLTNSDHRILAVGRHFIKPNITTAYAIQDLRMTGALLPERLPLFTSLCTAHRRDRAPVFEKGILTPAVDLASVRFVLSRGPVRGSDDPLTGLTPLAALQKSPARIVPGLALTGGSLTWQRQQRQIAGTLDWQADENAARNHVTQLVLLDEGGKELWTGDEYALHHNPREGGLLREHFMLAVPAAVKPGSRLRIGLRVINVWTTACCWPETSPFQQAGPMMLLADLRLPEAMPADNSPPARPHFILTGETASGIRVYENTRAMPPAYLSRRPRLASSAEEASAIIASPSFATTEEVVIEGTSGTPPAIPAAREDAPSRAVTLVDRPDVNTVIVYASSHTGGALVLTDTYYPGWTATVDGSSVPILRANVLFRAVLVPPGAHRIEFRYQPLSFWLGAGLALLCASTLAALLIWQAIRNRTRPKAPPSRSERREPKVLAQAGGDF